MIGHGQIEGFTEKYGMEFQRARLDETPNAGPDRPLRGPDRAAPPRAAAVRRLGRLPAVRRRRRRRRARRGRLRLLERPRRRALADRLPQPVRRRRPAGSATRSRSRSSTTTARRRRAATAWPTRSSSPGRPTAGSASATGGPGWSRSARSARSAIAACSSSSAPTSASSSTSCARSSRPPTSRGRGSPASSAGAASPSLDEALADHRLRPVHDAVGRLLVAMTADESRPRRVAEAAVRTPAEHRRRQRRRPAAADPAGPGASIRRPGRPLGCVRSRARRAADRDGAPQPASTPAAIERTRSRSALAHPATMPDPAATRSPRGSPTPTSGRSSRSTTGTARTWLVARALGASCSDLGGTRSIGPAGREARVAGDRAGCRAAAASRRLSASDRLRARLMATGPTPTRPASPATPTRAATEPASAQRRSRSADAARTVSPGRSRRRSGIGGVPWPMHASRCSR